MKQTLRLGFESTIAFVSTYQLFRVSPSIHFHSGVVVVSPSAPNFYSVSEARGLSLLSGFLFQLFGPFLGSAKFTLQFGDLFQFLMN